MTTVYKILESDAWQRARALGEFRGSALDLRDGFIHFSSAAQVASTARLHFARVADLVLLYVRTDALPASAWRWEPARDGSLFPHLYGVLPASAAHRVEPLPLDSDGMHQLPDLEP